MQPEVSQAGRSGPRVLSDLGRIRTLRGHTRASLSAVSGISERQIANLEKGVCEPKLKTATAIATALGTTIEAIFPELLDPAGDDRKAPDG